MTNREFQDRLASILSEVRTKATLSQSDMAKKMDVSKKTIQNWESGSSAPDIVQFFRWFRECSTNPMPWLISFVYPKSRMPKESSRDTAHKYVDGLTEQELECFNFLVSGQHGSSPYACFQEIICNLQSPILNRYTIAVTVENNYRVAKDMGMITSPDAVQPDMDAFCDAIAQGRRAAVSGNYGYTALQRLAIKEFMEGGEVITDIED